MNGSLNGSILVSAQLSSITSARPIHVRIPSIKPVDLSKETDSFPAEHAVYSTTLQSEQIGTILLRVLHEGRILELTSLSLDLPPIRFVFSSPVLPSPGLFLWEDKELHVVALTQSGSIHRLVVPLKDGQGLWVNEDDDIWTNEYVVKTFPDGVRGVVFVQGAYCVTVGTANGSLVRFDTDYVGANGPESEWTESVFHPGSFLSSWTSFLSTSSSEGSEIVSISSHPWPTDVGAVWSLSRDRVLRYWKPKVGCVSSKTLAVAPGRELTPSPSSSTNGVKPQILLPSGPQTLIRVFQNAPDDDRLFILTFIPTPSLSTSGGTFHLLATYGDHMNDVAHISASPQSAYCRLQDFVVVDRTLHTLWDRQGQSTVESTVLSFDVIDIEIPKWIRVSYPPEVELTPAYLEEVLLSPGSLADKFFEAIMRPGMFSPLTLRLAIDKYMTDCNNTPGPLAPQLKMSYSSVGEQIATVVGCMVILRRDPHTGALLHSQYWNALKRDWEGFIARCREIERSARGPLALGRHDKSLIVVERERVSLVVRQDLPISIHNALVFDHPIDDPQYELFGALWALRSHLGPQTLLDIENGLVDIMHQEIAFTLSEIVQDQARRARFREKLDEGTISWITGRLQAIPDISEAVKVALDVIGGLDYVKPESDDGSLLTSSPSRSEWWRAVSADYTFVSVNTRYDLCLSLVTLLFFQVDQLNLWSPALLAEIFAVLRGMAAMRYVVRQRPTPASQGGREEVAAPATSEVVSLMDNMHVSRNSGPQPVQTVPLVHKIFDIYSIVSIDVHLAAHEFLDRIGWFQSVSPSRVCHTEVSFCEKLRQLGYYHVVREIMGWLPRTPAVTYVLARLYINIGRSDDAALLLEKLAGRLGSDINVMSDEDRLALSMVLTEVDLGGDPYFFYLHVASLFRTKSLVYQETVFTQLALSVAPPEINTTPLWATVTKGYTDLGMYDDAYSVWSVTPDEKQKRESASHLVYRMCECDAAPQLMSYNFTGYTDEVEDALAFKVRNADPRTTPNYSKILYGWYTNRGDHRNAALTMYQRARKLRELITPSTVSSFIDESLEAYLVALNSLALADPKIAWIIIPGSLTTEHPRKRRKIKNIPEDHFTPGKYDNEVIHLEDIQYEYALLTAQVDMLIRHASSEFPLPPSSIVLRLSEQNCFDRALSTARSLNVDMTDIFTRLAIQCLRLSRDPELVFEENTSDWLLTDKVSSWAGTTADKAWRYLRQSLAVHDSLETDYRYTKTVLETIMQHQRSPPPPWLITSLETHHHEFLIRINLRYGNFGSAIEHTLSLIQKEEARLARDPPKTAGSTWLPYSTIDQVLVAAAEQDKVDPQLSKLRSEITARLRRVEKLNSFER